MNNYLPVNLLALRGMISEELWQFFADTPEPKYKYISKFGMVSVLNPENQPLWGGQYKQLWAESWQYYQQNGALFRLKGHFKTIKDPLAHTPPNQFVKPVFDYCHNICPDIIANTNGPIPFLIMFGLGLDGIFQWNEPLSDIIIIDDLWYIHAHLCWFDWRALIDQCRGNLGKIVFIPTNDSLNYATMLAQTIGPRHSALIEGGRVFTLPGNPAYMQFMANIGQFYGLASWFNGWLEDESHHWQAIKQNLGQGGLIQPQPKPNPQHHALIIGAGPSLTAEMALLKAHHQQYILFSCGSALEVLCQHGITPHYHLELENSEYVLQKIDIIANKYDLSNICLCASLTTPPPLAQYFKNRLYFLREGEGIAQIFQSVTPQLPQSGRSVACSALAIALGQQFASITLLGCDLAMVDGRDHADNISIYQDESAKNVFTKEFGQCEVDGNFGGRVTTNNIWLFFKEGMEALCHGHTHIFNASHGARIMGAGARKFADIVQQTPQHNTPFHIAHNVQPPVNLSNIHKNIAEFLPQTINQLHNMLAGQAQATDFTAFYHAYWVHLHQPSQNPISRLAVMEWHKILFYTYSVYWRLPEGQRLEFLQNIHLSSCTLAEEFAQKIKQLLN